ncbi:MAG: glycoside hydrolase family 32 protein [Propionicimonas sp.]
MPLSMQPPRYHFAPSQTWANDPNGLIWHQGVWHLFFQCNPEGVDWGNMSWGHATSPDLITWQEQPIALRWDEREQFFSGSCVFDARNSSGLGTDESPALVAIYTAVLPDGIQAQSLAYSLDAGLTWQRYPGNPVLDRGSANFRDPKVFRHDNSWVMVAVEAEQQTVVLYRSTDLISWDYLSSFGPAHAAAGAWECPDLFPLPVAGTEELRWVLLVNLNPGAVAGGSGCQYFVGEFDGTRFVPERDAGVAIRGASEGPDLRGFDWFDHGRDCYAVVSFADPPDGRRIVLGWMNNWDYAAEVPLTGGRGMMTIPRELWLVRRDGRHLLAQRPVRELPTEALRRVRLADGENLTFGAATLAFTDGALRVAREPVDFDARFAGTTSVQIAGSPEGVELDVLVDTCSIEVFSTDGLVAITNLVI